MKQIKLRIYADVYGDNEMIYLDEIEIYKNCIAFDSEKDIYKGISIMQNIGKLDDNKKEIYEGDILKITWRTASKGRYFQMDDAYVEHEEIVHVKYHNTGYCFFKKDGKQFGMSNNYNVEIIGNIYENSELLSAMAKTEA